LPDPGDKTDKPSGSVRQSSAETTPYHAPSDSGATMDFDLAEATLAALRQRYELLAELGRGGMGVVYKARDSETGDVVAVKVLLPEIAARSDILERFKSELLLARKITHKNICRVHDLNRFGPVAAISMEFIEGESLRALLDRVDGVSLRQGRKILQQVLAEMGMTPEREPQEVANHPLVNESAPDLLMDGTERRRQRPKDAQKQEAHYSGKKKAHTDKNLLLANTHTRKVVYLSPTENGKKHDKKIADENDISYPSNATLGKDTGFQGYEPKGVLTFQPKKSQKARS